MPPSRLPRLASQLRPALRRRLSTTRAAPPPQLALIPPHAWDAHMHVTDPALFPLSASATYAPHAAPLAAARASAARLRLPNQVFVQPSTYGHDNACLLHCLRAAGPWRARGVVTFDPAAATDTELRAWHAAGVRGARVNLVSAGPAGLGRDQVLALVARVADRVRPLGGWAVEVLADLKDVAPLLEELVYERLRGVKFAVAHLGLPREPGGRRMEECEGGAVLRRVMARSEDVFVKVSGAYRLSQAEGWRDLERYTRDLLDVRGGRGVVFASDWPHTRFEGLEVMPWIERCVDWCDGDAALRDKLFRDNAKRLWDVQED